MKFQPFKPGGRKEFDDCFASATKFFGETSDEIQKWRTWAESIPQSDDVEEFVER